MRLENLIGSHSHGTVQAVAGDSAARQETVTKMNMRGTKWFDRDSELRSWAYVCMVLGLMAFVAASAQAEAGANWKVNGANVTSTLKPGVTAALENETASLLTTILGIPTKILCKALAITNTLEHPEALTKEKSNSQGVQPSLKNLQLPRRLAYRKQQA